MTEQKPSELHYVQNLDQLWILGEQNSDDVFRLTNLIVRQASVKMTHQPVHVKPLADVDLFKQVRVHVQINIFDVS